MTTNLLLFAFFVASMILMSFNYKKKKKQVMFFGDSITEQGVERNGYISIIQDFIRAQDEEEKYSIIGAGIGGNKVADLLQRLDKDVLLKGPDIVVIFIGVNDAWHKNLTGSITPYEKFKSDFETLVNKLTSAEIKMILCTPAVIGEKTNGTNEFDKDLDNYSSIIKTVAENNSLSIVDIRNTFLDYNIAINLDNKESGILTRDSVHLNNKGNEIVAREIWKVLKNIK